MRPIIKSALNVIRYYVNVKCKKTFHTALKKILQLNVPLQSYHNVRGKLFLYKMPNEGPVLG